MLYTRADQTMARGHYRARQRLFCGPPQSNDFIVIFLVWLLVTRINCLRDSNTSEAVQTLFHQNVKPNNVLEICLRNSFCTACPSPEEDSEVLCVECCVVWCRELDTTTE